ncbi:MAG TPA: entericidin EcnAB [Sulfurovum sp. UBA12169]|nr:MAG TPA: entericidin EcnAB [Sulfurovum sp. UBA12169]
MKKRFIWIAVGVIGFFMNGCATWSGIKYDSSKAWKSTKKAVHDVTSD